MCNALIQREKIPRTTLFLNYRKQELPIGAAVPQQTRGRHPGRPALWSRAPRQRAQRGAVTLELLCALCTKTLNLPAPNAS